MSDKNGNAAPSRLSEPTLTTMKMQIEDDNGPSNVNDDAVSSRLFRLQAFLEHVAEKQQSQMEQVFRRLEQIESCLGKMMPSSVTRSDKQENDSSANKTMDMGNVANDPLKEMKGIGMASTTMLQILERMEQKQETSLREITERMAVVEGKTCQSLKGVTEVVESMKVSYTTKELSDETMSPSSPLALSSSRNYGWKEKEPLVFAAPNDNRYRSRRLDCPAMTVGRCYQWKLDITNVGGDVGLGVMSSVHHLGFDDYLGYKKDGWAYHFNGNVWHNHNHTKSGLPTFGVGRGTWTLDMTTASASQMTGGTLSVELVEGQSNKIVVTENILKDCAEAGVTFATDDDGFYPAVSGATGSCVKFVEFQSI